MPEEVNAFFWGDDGVAQVPTVPEFIWWMYHQCREGGIFSERDRQILDFPRDPSVGAARLARGIARSLLSQLEARLGSADPEEREEYMRERGWAVGVRITRLMAFSEAVRSNSACRGAY